VFLASAPMTVIVGQAVMGVGGALVLPNSLAIVTHAFTDTHERTMAVGAWTAVSGLGLAIGPITAGVLLKWFSWHSVFLVNVVIAAIVLTLTPRFVADSRHPNRRLDPPGLALTVLAIAALNYAVITGGNGGFGQTKIVVAFAVSALAVITFIRVESRRAAPMLHLPLFRIRSFSAANVIGFVAQFSVAAIALLEVLWFEQVQHASVLTAGARILPLMVAYVAVSSVAAYLARRVGFKQRSAAD